MPRNPTFLRPAHAKRVLPQGGAAVAPEKPIERITVTRFVSVLGRAERREIMITMPRLRFLERGEAAR